MRTIGLYVSLSTLSKRDSGRSCESKMSTTGSQMQIGVETLADLSWATTLTDWLAMVGTLME